MTSTDRHDWDMPTPGASVGTWAQTLNDLIDEQIESHTWIGKPASSDTTANNYEFIFGDASGGSITITLPPPRDDIVVGIKKINSANDVVVATPGSETIDGASSVSISNEDHAIILMSDGSDYFITSYQNASV